MKNHYIVFKKTGNEDFIGFTSIDPTTSSGVAYRYLQLTEEDFTTAIKEFENGKTLELNDEKTYFVAK